MSVPTRTLAGDGFVLLCRCGQGLRLRDMHRQEPPRRVPSGHLVLRPITCAACAGRAR